MLEQDGRSLKTFLDGKEDQLKLEMESSTTQLGKALTVRYVSWTQGKTLTSTKSSNFENMIIVTTYKYS